VDGHKERLATEHKKEADVLKERHKKDVDEHNQQLKSGKTEVEKLSSRKRTTQDQRERIG
jgi:hypothetical protein